MTRWLVVAAMFLAGAWAELSHAQSTTATMAVTVIGTPFDFETNVPQYPEILDYSPHNVLNTVSQTVTTTVSGPLTPQRETPPFGGGFLSERVTPTELRTIPEARAECRGLTGNAPCAPGSNQTPATFGGTEVCMVHFDHQFFTVQNAPTVGSEVGAGFACNHNIPDFQVVAGVTVLSRFFTIGGHGCPQSAGAPLTYPTSVPTFPTTSLPTAQTVGPLTIAQGFPVRRVVNNILTHAPNSSGTRYTCGCDEPGGCRLHCSGSCNNGCLTRTCGAATLETISDTRWYYTQINIEPPNQVMSVSLSVDSTTVTANNAHRIFPVFRKAGGGLRLTSNSVTLSRSALLGPLFPDVMNADSATQLIAQLNTLQTVDIYGQLGLNVADTFSPLGAGIVSRLSPFGQSATITACPAGAHLINTHVAIPTFGDYNSGNASVPFSVSFAPFCTFVSGGWDVYIRTFFILFGLIALGVRLIWDKT